jgi:hypothetical protein
MVKNPQPNDLRSKLGFQLFHFGFSFFVEALVERGPQKAIIFPLDEEQVGSPAPNQLIFQSGAGSPSCLPKQFFSHYPHSGEQQLLPNALIAFSC